MLPYIMPFPYLFSGETFFIHHLSNTISIHSYHPIHTIPFHQESITTIGNSSKSINTDHIKLFQCCLINKLIPNVRCRIKICSIACYFQIISSVDISSWVKNYVFFGIISMNKSTEKSKCEIK